MSGLRLFNTLTRKKEEFIPLKDKKINLFVCGLTVYDDAHLGHAKTFINFDVIARWLRHLGFEVKYVQNITDIDDKIIARAKERNEDPIQLARNYEKRFMEDLQAIKAKESVDEFPRSHDYIAPVGKQIQLLLDKDYAYYIDGDIYYDVKKFKDYTKLSRMKLEELEKHRIEPKEGKRNSYDFVLWKAAKPGEPTWKTAVRIKGREVALVGRPGWHIEDTAMTYEIFGPQYDVHGGANELIFPHHSNEIAQAEAAFGIVPFVRYWLHSGVLFVEGAKMSKSLKNFVTIRQALQRYRPEALRLQVLSTHYRKDVNYTEASIKEAEKRLSYLYIALGIFSNMPVKETDDDKLVNEYIRSFKEEFETAMNDDFNVPLALASLTRTLNSLRIFADTHQSIGKATKESAIKEILDTAQIFGLLEDEDYRAKLPKEVAALIKERERLRKEKSFGEADLIRDKIKEQYGLIVEDTEYGTIWYKMKV